MINKSLRNPPPKEPEPAPYVPKKYNASFVGHTTKVADKREAYQERLK